jgi:hypothetical protein
MWLPNCSAFFIVRIDLVVFAVAVTSLQVSGTWPHYSPTFLSNVLDLVGSVILDVDELPLFVWPPRCWSSLS